MTGAVITRPVDCVKVTHMIMDDNFVEQLELGSSELVSINQLVAIMEEVGGVKLKQSYKIGRRRQSCPMS
jgi:GDP-D-mannose 3',5'-epimerase